MALLCKLCTLLAASTVALFTLTALGVFNSFILPKIPEIKDQYWGEGAAKPDKTDIKPFKIAVPDKDLQDLKQRLKAFRFIQPVEDAKFLYGFNGDFTKKLVKYWSDKYNWREWETRLNSFSHFKTQIQGLEIHFIRAKADPSAKVILPLLLLHGWPGSVFEFYKIIPQLTKPVDGVAFEVIAPSIPGFGWSEAPHKSGFNAFQCAHLYHNLMTRLGFKDNYYVQGGDFGSVVGGALARLEERKIKGFHTNMIQLPHGHPQVMIQVLLGAIYPPLVLPEKDIHKVYPLKERFQVTIREMGYLHIQATRPDSVGHSLNDSPVGLAAYILEKFSLATKMHNLEKADGNLMNLKISMDEMLTDIMIYWFTGSITSSMRFYKETFADWDNHDSISTVTRTPAGGAAFPYELATSPEKWFHYAYPNLLHYADYSEGGHFAALEVPHLLEKDIRLFVKKAEEFWRVKKQKKTEL